jgi:hypothetical protein
MAQVVGYARYLGNKYPYIILNTGATIIGCLFFYYLDYLPPPIVRIPTNHKLSKVIFNLWLHICFIVQEAISLPPENNDVLIEIDIWKTGSYGWGWSAVD